MKQLMKTPISYYGGKQTMIRHILPNIPAHTMYTEAFAGGVAVLYAKEPSEIEVINDTNGELINFYKVAKCNFNALQAEVNATLHSRDIHCLAGFIYNYPHFFEPVKRAWAVWVLSKMSFSSKLNGTFGYDKAKNTMPKKLHNAKDDFTEQLMARLNRVTIESTDGKRVIASRDGVDAFHFVDPPYVNTDLGHYAGSFVDSDFLALLNTLADVRGRFMLTMFPNEELTRYILRHKWRVVEVERHISASKVKRRVQTELIVMNY